MAKCCEFKIEKNNKIKVCCFEVVFLTFIQSTLTVCHFVTVIQHSKTNIVPRSSRIFLFRYLSLTLNYLSSNKLHDVGVTQFYVRREKILKQYESRSVSMWRNRSTNYTLLMNWCRYFYLLWAIFHNTMPSETLP